MNCDKVERKKIRKRKREERKEEETKQVRKITEEK